MAEVGQEENDAPMSTVGERGLVRVWTLGGESVGKGGAFDVVEDATQ